MFVRAGKPVVDNLCLKMGNCNNCLQDKREKDVKIDHFGPAVEQKASSNTPTFDLPAPRQDQELAVQYRETRKPVQASQQEPLATSWQGDAFPPAKLEVGPEFRLNVDALTVQNALRMIVAKRTIREAENSQRDLPDPVDRRPETSSPIPDQDFLNRLTRECRSTLQSLPKYKFSFSVRNVVSYPPCSLVDGSVYVGQWAAVGSGRYRKGKGRLYKADGSYQEGYWVGAQLHTHGRTISTSGDYYEGGMLEGQRSGEGLFKSYDQRTEYRGYWANDQKQGKGTERKPDDSLYTGDFDRNERSGRGKLSMVEGKIYEGGFQNGRFSGKGVHTWKDGRRYEGGWRDGKMHGFGKFVYPDGKTYEGQYADDKKNGQGIYKWEGKVYDGEWVNGKMHGVGWLITEKGKKKYEFRNGERGKEIRE